MSFTNKAAALIDNKAFDELEALWMEQMEADPSMVDQFLGVARALRKAEERSRADALLELLADTLADHSLWSQRLTVLEELARLSRKPQTFRAPIEEAVRNSLSHKPSFDAVMAAVGFAESEGNPSEKAEKVRSWLTFDIGETFYMAGRGVGIVTELNASLALTRLDFENEKRVSVPLGAAPKHLVPIPEGHVLQDKTRDPEGLRQRVAANPAETLAAILRTFGRSMTASQVKDVLTGIVPEGKWSSWWTAARKHPQVVASGSGARATYSWSATSSAADESILNKFNRATLRQKLDVAKKQSGRSAELADTFAATLAAEAAAVAASDPALAWEVFATLEKLPGRYDIEFDPDHLLTSTNAARLVGSISDRALREQAIRVVSNKHEDAVATLAEIFFLEEDPRVLSLIESLLLEHGAEARRDRLIDETLRYPRRHPRAFYWYIKKLNDAGQLPPRGANNVLQQLLDALTSEEFAPHRPRIKELFDRGGIAVQIVMNAITEDQARKLVDTLERYGSLEEYRREIVRAAALMKYPSLREPQVEPLYATAESLTAKRDEYERLRSVEIPANLKAIQEAREMGDLRENFEYKAARQRQEYLAARVGELQGELARVRVLDPQEVETSEVRVGTRLVLSNGDIRRDVTILGPWESAPEQGIYSNQSEVAKALLGKQSGEIVTFMGNDYLIESINRWTE